MTDTCARCEKILKLIGDLAIPADQENVDEFIDAVATVSPKYLTPSVRIYSAYVAWCDLNAKRSIGRNKLGAALEARGFRSHRGTGGVRLRRGIRVP